MAITDLYVSSDGTGDGSSSSVPMSWSTFSTRLASGGSGAAGDRYNLKAGTYTLSATDTWAIDGTAASPIVIRGCDASWNPITPTRSGDNGALDTTNMPYINYDGNYGLAANGSNFMIFVGLRINSARTGSTLYIGQNSVAYGCVVTGTANSSSAHPLRLSTGCLALNCDASESGTTAGPGAILIAGDGCRVIGCRITDSPSYGILVSSTYYHPLVAFNRISGCDDYGIYVNNDGSARTFTALHNTIYGGKGIGCADVAFTALWVCVGNHITDGAAYAFENPNATGSAVFLAHNRTRDNASGPISWNGDWDDATTFSHVTTDAGDASTDYLNAGSGDLNLIPTAAGVGVSFLPHLDIGALQREEPVGGASVAGMTGGFNG